LNSYKVETQVLTTPLAFECEQVEEECDISDTVERCKGPGEAKQSLGRVSKAMRRTCFIRPSHLIVGMRKPKDAPIAVTPGVRISALLNRTEKMDKDIGKTFDKIQVNNPTPINIKKETTKKRATQIH
jgi:hypothetical protein